MIHDNEINVRFINFPGPTKEVVSPNSDETYTIFINAALSDVGRLQAYEHALRHIESLDFESEEDVQSIEAYAHELVEVAPCKTVSEETVKEDIEIVNPFRSTKRQIAIRRRKLKELEERNWYIYNNFPEAYMRMVENICTRTYKK